MAGKKKTTSATVNTAKKKKTQSSVDSKKKEVVEKKKEISEKKKEVVPTNKVSRVAKNHDIYTDDFTITKEPFHFDKQRLDDMDSLDDTFVEMRHKKKHPQVITPIEEVEEEPKNRNKLVPICIILVLLLLVSVGFNVFNLTMNSKKPKVKTVTKTVIKKVMDDNYVFLGDSITKGYDLKEYFKDYPVVNSGIDGNTTTDILENMESRLYQYNPTKVFLLIGTNDLNKKEKEEIVSNIHKIVKEIQKNRPYCEIYLESIYPINNTEDDKIDYDVVTEERNNEEIQEINEEIKQMAEEEKITYIDLYSLLVDDENNLNIDYTTEGLHISAEGYQVITDEIMKYMKK